MEHNITVTFDGEVLNIDDNNVDWFAFGCTVGLMTAEDESEESWHDLNEFMEGIRAALEYHDRNQEKTDQDNIHI